MLEKMRYEIDLTGVRTKKQFHDRIQKSIPCPEYYGRNMDALYDVITENGNGWELVFLEFEKFAEAMPGYGSALKNMCQDAMEECDNLKISFE